MTAAATLDPKVLQNLTARCCLAGVVLTMIDGEGEPLFAVRRWNLCKFLTLNQLHDFLRRAGGPSA